MIDDDEWSWIGRKWVQFVSGPAQIIVIVQVVEDHMGGPLWFVDDRGRRYSWHNIIWMSNYNQSGGSNG
jgi:hypothetical protein